jgi:hypothetical protein
MPIKKPTFAAPKTTDLKKSLERLAKYTKDVQKGDGTLDMDDLEAKVARSRTDGVAEGLDVIKDAFTRTRTRSVSSGCGGGTTTRRVEVPADKLKKAEVQSVITALLAAQAKVDQMDANGDGKLSLSEMSLRLSGLAGELAQSGAHGARADFERSKTDWMNTVMTARESIEERESFDQDLTASARHHAETGTGCEAIEWAYREMATRFPDDLYSIDVDSFLDDAEAAFLRAAPWGGSHDTSRGHLSDVEVKGFLGTDDLKGFIKKMKAQVKKNTGGDWNDWVGGKDLAGHADIHDPEIEAEYTTPSSGGGC